MALTIKQAEYAIKQSAGNVSEAARELGVARSTLNAKISKSPKLQQVVRDEREELFDIAVSQLRQNASRGNMTAIAIIINNSPIAKENDWGPRTRHEITGADGGRLQVTVNWPEDDDEQHPDS